MCCFLAEWLCQFDLNKGDDLKVHPFMDQGRCGEFTEVLWCLIHYFVTNFGSIVSISYPNRVNTAADLLNIVVPYLGDPEGGKKYRTLEKVRLFRPGLIAHLGYTLMHVPIPSRDGVMQKDHIVRESEVCPCTYLL